MSLIPDTIRELLEKSRKRLLPGERMSFELPQGQQHRQRELMEFFDRHGFACGGRFATISKSAIDWLKEQGLNLTGAKVVDIADKYR